MVYKAIVINLNSKTTDAGSVLAIARAEACKREQVKENPTIRALVYVAELGVFCAVYEAAEKSKPEPKITVQK